MDEMLQFVGLVKAVTQDACLINIDGVTGWVPDSKTDYIDEPIVDKEIKLEIPEWLATKKGFIEL